MSSQELRSAALTWVPTWSGFQSRRGGVERRERGPAESATLVAVPVKGIWMDLFGRMRLANQSETIPSCVSAS